MTDAPPIPPARAVFEEPGPARLVPGAGIDGIVPPLARRAGKDPPAPRQETAARRRALDLLGVL